MKRDNIMDLLWLINGMELDGLTQNKEYIYLLKKVNLKITYQK